MNDLRKAAEMALEALEANLGKWAAKTKAVEALRQALVTPEVTPEVAKRKTLAELLDSTPVDAVNISQERVDETAKRNCDNCESLRRAAWDRINELEAKLEERENNALFNDVLKSFKLYAESLGIKLKEKNT
jgi:hypothetical protein